MHTVGQTASSVKLLIPEANEKGIGPQMGGVLCAYELNCSETDRFLAEDSLALTCRDQIRMILFSSGVVTLLSRKLNSPLSLISEAASSKPVMAAR